jgi:succinoglycan biosynthesis transport protein ExoP
LWGTNNAEQQQRCAELRDLSDIHLPSAPSPDDGHQPEVRLELTRAGVEQVLSLYSPGQRAHEAENGFAVSLEDLLEAVRKRRRMLATGWGIGVVLAGLVLLFSTKLYPVGAQVVLERHEVSSASIEGGSGAGGSSFIATQAEVMKSESVVGAAVASLPPPAHLDEDDDPVADAMEAVEASPVSGTQVVALGYLGPDAEYGARLLNAIVDSYRSVLREDEKETQTRNLRAKQAEIEALDQEARDAEARIVALREKYQILGNAEDAASAQSTVLREQASQLSEARRQRIALQSRLAAGGDQIAILDPATRTLQEQLWQAEAALGEVRLTLKPRHPAVEAAQQRVNALRAQLASSSRATPEAIKRDLAAATNLEQQLEVTYERERTRMTEIEAFRREEQLLTAELDRIRSMSDARRQAVLDQRLVTRLADAGEVGVSARVIQAPRLPEGPAWPRPKLLLALGSILGLAGGLAAALVSLHQQRQREQWAPSPPSRAMTPEGVGTR